MNDHTTHVKSDDHVFELRLICKNPPKFKSEKARKAWREYTDMLMFRCGTYLHELVSDMRRKILEADIQAAKDDMEKDNAALLRRVTKKK